MDDLEKLRCKPSRMYNVLYFILGRNVWCFYKKRDKLGRFLFGKFGAKFVWLDCLVRRFKIASHIEIYDANRYMVIIDGKPCYFYSKYYGHYLVFSTTQLSQSKSFNSF